MTTVINGVPRKLKPCPFCGGSAESRLYDCQYFVQCIECFNSTAADHQTEEDAVAAWNKRATAQPADHSEHDLNMVSQPAADGEREAFEVWLSSIHPVNKHTFARNGEGYAYNPAGNYWKVWQARAAQPQQAVAVTDEVRRLREALTKAKGVLEEVWEFSYEHGAASALSARDMAEEISAVLSAHKTGEEE